MKILVTQTSFLGDVILSTPVMTAVKQLYPEAELWLLTTPAGAALLTHDSRLKGVITFDKRGKERGLRGLWLKARELRAQRFNKVYSLHRSFRTALLLWLAGIPERIGFMEAYGGFLYHRRNKRNSLQHDVLRNLSILAHEVSIENLSTKLCLFTLPRENLRSELIKVLPERYAVIVPGSAQRTKMWDWQGYRMVAEELIALGLKVVVLGGENDRELSRKICQGLEVIDLSAKTSLPELLVVIKHSAVVICNDSMTQHVASAFNIPNVVIFCATSPTFGYGPWQNRAIVVEKTDLSCKPCSRHGGPRCPTGTEACMRELEAPQVITAIKTLLPELSMEMRYSHI